MFQESPVIPHNLTEILRLVVATFIAGAGGWFVRHRREPVELRRIDAETRQINTATDLSLIQAASDALAKASRMLDERNHWERKAGEFEHRLVQAEADAATAQMFVEQLNAAAKLTVCEHYPNGVRLSDYTPRQLNPGKE